MLTLKKISTTEFRLHNKLYNANYSPQNYFESFRFEIIFQRLLLWFFLKYGFYFFIQKLSLVDDSFLFQLYFYKTYLLIIEVQPKQVDLVALIGAKTLQYQEQYYYIKNITKYLKYYYLHITLVLNKSLKPFKKQKRWEIRTIFMQRKRKKLIILAVRAFYKSNLQKFIYNKFSQKIKKGILAKKKLCKNNLREFSDNSAFFTKQRYIIMRKKKRYKRGIRAIKRIIKMRIKLWKKINQLFIWNVIVTRRKIKIYKPRRLFKYFKQRKKKFKKFKNRTKKYFFIEKIKSESKFRKRKKVKNLLILPQIAFPLFFTYFFKHFFGYSILILYKSLYKHFILSATLRREHRHFLTRTRYLHKTIWVFDFLFFTHYALIKSDPNFILPYFIFHVKSVFKQATFINFLMQLLEFLYFYKKNIRGYRIIIHGAYDRKSRETRSRTWLVKKGDITFTHYESHFYYDTIQWPSLYGISSVKIWWQYDQNHTKFKNENIEDEKKKYELQKEYNEWIVVL